MSVYTNRNIVEIQTKYFIELSMISPFLSFLKYTNALFFVLLTVYICITIVQVVINFRKKKKKCFFLS